MRWSEPRLCYTACSSCYCGNAPITGRQRPSQTNDSRCRCHDRDHREAHIVPRRLQVIPGVPQRQGPGGRWGVPPGLLASTLLAPRASETHPGRIPGAFYRRSRNATAISTPTTSTTAPAPRSRRGSWSAAYRGTVLTSAAFASSVAPDPSQSERPHEPTWRVGIVVGVTVRRAQPEGAVRRDEDAVHVVAVWISFLQ